MPDSRPHCTHCNIALSPDADRCPRCLRKSTIVDPADTVAHPVDGEAVPYTPKHTLVRLALTALAWACSAPLIWLAFAHEAWLQSHDLWLATLAVTMGLATLPLRMAFQALPGTVTSTQAARYYGLLMLLAAGISLGMGIAMAVATWLTDGVLAAVFLGLLLFLLPLFGGPVLIGAVRRREPVAKTLETLAKRVALAVAVVAVVALLVWLRTLESPPKRTLYIPEDPKALLDPLDLQSVRLTSRTLPDTHGRTALHLQADGGDLRRTLAKLNVAALMAADKMTKDPTASGQIRCWVPERLRTPLNAKELDREQRDTNAALEGANLRTTTGQPLRVLFAFGEIPAG